MCKKCREDRSVLVGAVAAAAVACSLGLGPAPALAEALELDVPQVAVDAMADTPADGAVSDVKAEPEAEAEGEVDEAAGAGTQADDGAGADSDAGGEPEAEVDDADAAGAGAQADDGIGAEDGAEADDVADAVDDSGAEAEPAGEADDADAAGAGAQADDGAGAEAEPAGEAEEPADEEDAAPVDEAGPEAAPVSQVPAAPKARLAAQAPAPAPAPMAAAPSASTAQAAAGKKAATEKKATAVKTPTAKAEEKAPKRALATMWRLYNPNSGEHFYTASLGEARSVAAAGWRWEGAGWVAPADEGDPVFRLYNPNAGDHHYTLSAAERDSLRRAGWRYEGVAFRSDGTAGSLAVLRQYNPNAASGAHNFTLSAAERNSLKKAGWRDEGVGWRAADAEPEKIQGFWLVTTAWGTLERYWVAADGRVATSRLVTPEEGAGWLAYARKGGAVVRGAVDRGDGTSWLADQDGRLAKGESGWRQTSAYGGGKQWYLLVSKEGGRYAVARNGLFSEGGSRYYAAPSKGYVTRNAMATVNGTHYWADNDGRLTDASSGKVGWQNPSQFYQVSSFNVANLPSYAHGYFTYISPSRLAVNATRADALSVFMARITEYLGTPYRWDWAMRPGEGVDCAGLVLQGMYSVGMSTKYNTYDHMNTPGHDHYANDMRNDSKIMKVSFSDRQYGDLVFYSGHVGVYVGNNTIINAIGDRVQYSSVYVMNPINCGRLFI